MIEEARDLMWTLEYLTGEILRLMDGAPAAALDWAPAPETNSPAAIVTHALGASRHWLVVNVGGGGSDRNREAEFHARAGEIGDLHARAEAWLADARRVLEATSTAALDAPGHALPPAYQDFSARQAVLHVIEHIGTHVGHLELTLQLWRAQQPAR